jgi:hypothetical protein
MASDFESYIKESKLLVHIKEQFLSSKRKITILDSDYDKAALLCKTYGVEPNSIFAMITCGTGGISIDNWIRILASGERDLTTWNDTLNIDNYFVVADDVLGGLFAMNKQSSIIEYFAPDTLEWETLDLYYPHFIEWLLDDSIDSFYDNFKWENWQNDVENLGFNEGIAFYPFLWAKSNEERSRRAMPLREIVLMSLDIREQIDGASMSSAE